MKTLAALLLVTVFLLSCGERNGYVTDTPPYAYVPQYASLAEIQKVSIQEARATKQAGKIYVSGNYLFQNEIQQGFHIIDNTDRKHPAKLAFLRVPYSTEISIKGNFLYTNNYNDLVVIDISDLRSPRLVKRIEHAFPAVDQKFPPEKGVLFECPDPSKGIIMQWDWKESNSASCRR